MNRCSHCNNPEVISSPVYNWYCPKCCRYELRPIVADMPMSKEMFLTAPYNPHMETVQCGNPKCKQDYKRKKTSPRTLCGHCYNLWISAEGRKKRKEKQEKQRAQALNNLAEMLTA